jgi:hypothetical protein
MAKEGLPGGVNPFARAFSLSPPPRGGQFRTAALNAERRQRKAERRMAAALGTREDSDAPPRGVNIVELGRIWSSFAFKELRRDLSPEAEKRLHRQLAAVLAGEEGAAAVWWATVSALNEARRAADLSADVRPRNWRQDFSSSDYW